MKKIVIPALLLASGIALASCGNSAPAHSKSFDAGVSWIKDGFPGANENLCDFSVLSIGANCNAANTPCDSNAAIFAESDGNYNMKQWIEGCISVPFKHYPKWYQNYISNLNS